MLWVTGKRSLSNSDTFGGNQNEKSQISCIDPCGSPLCGRDRGLQLRREQLLQRGRRQRIVLWRHLL